MLLSLLAFILVFIGCGTLPLSPKVHEQNIKTATSRLMVEGMTCINAYTSMEHKYGTAMFDSIVNKAANRAADEGHRDITVLVVAVDARTYVYEISYWK